MNIEVHPLEPFLPENGRILFLGSFPPPRGRWSMPSSSRAYPMRLEKKAEYYRAFQTLLTGGLGPLLFRPGRDLLPVSCRFAGRW